jgi:hypothetical protein
MIRRTLFPGRAPALPAVLAIAMLACVLPLNAGDAIDKSLFVSILDEAGKPLTDLGMGDILIREDNTDREVIAVKPASQPIAVAVLVDTAQGTRVTDAYGTPEEYTRDIRTSIGAFAKELLDHSPDASVSLMEFGQAAIPVVPFTQAYAVFQKGVNMLTAKPGVGSVLMEAIVQANKDLMARPSTRRAIVTLNLEPSDEQSREDTKTIIGSFKDSGAQLWSVSVQRGGLKSSKRDVVINEFSKNSGGKRDFIVGISAAEGILKGYAQALTSQYEVVYKRPESKKGPQQVMIGLARQGKFQIHASGFAPK